MASQEKHEIDPILLRFSSEQQQAPETRAKFLVELEKELGRPVVSFFTSFTFPVSLNDKDVDTLVGVLQMIDLSDGLAILINSPGGDGLAAERMIETCRYYSGTGEYWAIVPGKAKSAATMVCLGASKILMGPTSELGPVDPQLVAMQGDNTVRRYSAYNVVKSYKELFEKAAEAEGNLEPFLQQLSYYDPKDIKEFETAIELSQDIAIRALASGMMKEHSPEEIEDKIDMLLTPETTKTHGRPIYREAAKECGLEIECMESHTSLWDLVYELYIRADNFVSSWASKCIETKAHAFSTAIRQDR